MGIFRKQTEGDRLRNQYQSLRHEAFKLSRTDRKGSDKKYAEADALMQKIQQLDSLADV